MWGKIIVENSYQTNFNINFVNSKSDILIHLSQWQYWWWFWFSFIWVLYFFILLRILKFRTLKFRPKIATSQKPKGKWGDLIICLLPISWCFNILVNSNFLLKLIEWQNESSMFTIRIRGKQWYWIYKYDLKNIYSILSSSKNIGKNKWLVNLPNGNILSQNYFNSIQLKTNNEFIKKYWTNIFLKNSKNKKFNINNTYLFCNHKFKNNFSLKKKRLNFFFLTNIYKQNTFKNFYFFKNINIMEDLSCRFLTSFFKNFTIDFKKLKINFYLTNNNNILKKKLIHHTIVENSRFLKKKINNFKIIRLVKTTSNTKPFKFKFFFSNLSGFYQKDFSKSLFLTVKQKRAKKRKFVTTQHVVFYDAIKNKKKMSISVNTNLKNNIFKNDQKKNKSNILEIIKKNKIRNDNIYNNFNKRLLRTNKILILPSHVNITAITNSYDVIHSWYVPGLGLKLDCIPGRATHHTFYIDNVGFYYGQCAEVCGRYHHHMPIKICSLPFEHFLIWWHSFGLPKLIFSNNLKKSKYKYSFRKFSW